MNWDMEIVRCNRNILTTNLVDSTTLNISDPDVTMNMDTAADTADYILGGDKTPNTIRIRLKATYDFHMFEKVRNKLFRILRFWVPACMNVLLELATENQEPGGISDWRPPGADTLALNWLITNSAERTTNNPLWRTVNLAAL